MSFMGLTARDFVQALKNYRLNLRTRFLGSRIGFAWAILNPLLLMLVYVVVFGFVMKVRVSEDSGPMEYLIWFISGFAPWLAINDGITSTANAVISSVHLIKSFPIKAEVLPLSYTMMGLPQLLVGIALVVILSLVSGAGISLHILWLLVVIPVMFLFLAGLGFFLSALTVFFRDINQFIGTVLMFLLFFTPVFYTLDQLPVIVQKVTFFNPIFQIVDPFRQVLVNHQNINLVGFAYLFVLSAILWVLGLRFFRKRKGLFESVL